MNSKNGSTEIKIFQGLDADREEFISLVQNYSSLHPAVIHVYNELTYRYPLMEPIFSKILQMNYVKKQNDQYHGMIMALNNIKTNTIANCTDILKILDYIES